MYLTRMELDLNNRKTMQALASPSVLHGIVETAFSGEKNRKLWRIDTLQEKTYLLVLSPEKPDLTQAYQQIGMRDSEKPWQTKEYGSYISRIKPGEYYHFRIVANPTYSHHDPEETPGERARGQVCAHITVDQQKKWLMRRAENLGFALEEDQFEVYESRWRNFRKGKDKNRQVNFLSVTFEGRLKVTDAEQFRSTLINGIGRGKAYGMGLMTVIRR